MSRRLRHDMRSPMQVIQGAAEILGRADNLTEEQREVARMMGDNVKRLFAMVEELMELEGRQ